MRTRTAVALSAVLALLVFAAVAWAVQPAPGSHFGKSSQGMGVIAAVNNSHRIKRFGLQWKAKCTNGHPADEEGARDYDRKGDRIKQQNGTFSDTYIENRPVSPYYVLHEHTYFSGSFSTPNKATGHAHVHVQITKNGKKAGTCDAKGITFQIPVGH